MAQAAWLRRRCRTIECMMILATKSRARSESGLPKNSFFAFIDDMPASHEQHPVECRCLWPLAWLTILLSLHLYRLEP